MSFSLRGRACAAPLACVVLAGISSLALAQAPPAAPLPQQPPPSAAIKIADEPRAIDPASLLPPELAAEATVEFHQQSLSDVVQWLQTDRKLGVILEQGALEREGILPSEPITDQLAKAPLHLLLDRLRVAQIGWHLEDGLVRLTSLAAADARLRTVPYNVSDLFDAGYEPESLRDALSRTIAPQSWDEVGGAGSVTVLGDVLFVKQSPAEQLQVAGLLAALRKHGRRTYAYDPPSHQPLRAALAKKVSVQFQETALATAVAELARRGEADIRLDRASLEDAGVRERQPVSLALADQKLSVVLDALLDKLDLRWVLRDGAIWVVSAEEADAFTRPAVYDVRDLCRDAKEAQALQDALQSQLGEEHWDVGGGIGAMASPLPGVLVVSQTEPLHDRALELLENYRAALRASKPRVRAGTDPSEVLTRYYRLPSAMAADLAAALPQLVRPESWRTADRPEAPGTILKLASAPTLQTVAGDDAQPGVLVDYTVLVIQQRREVHEQLPEIFHKVAAGEFDAQQPFVTSVVPVVDGLRGGGLGGGGGFGGGFFAIPPR